MESNVGALELINKNVLTTKSRFLDHVFVVN